MSKSLLANFLDFKLFSPTSVQTMPEPIAAPVGGFARYDTAEAEIYGQVPEGPQEPYMVMSNAQFEEVARVASTMRTPFST